MRNGPVARHTAPGAEEHFRCDTQTPLWYRVVPEWPPDLRSSLGGSTHGKKKKASAKLGLFSFASAESYLLCKKKPPNKLCKVC